jgi:uncharacterized protein (TIGR03118 family)
MGRLLHVIRRDTSSWAHNSSRLLAGAAVLATAGSVFVPAALSSGGAAAAGGNSFAQTNLVASSGSFSPSLVDPNLTNAWGIALGPKTPIWISDNDSGVATVYGGGINGSPVSLDLTVPVPDGGGPTGQVFNSTLALKPPQQAFPVGGSSGGPADFIVSTEAVGAQGPAGEIQAWNGQAAFVTEDSPTGGPGGMTKPGALFFGLAVTPRSSMGPLLYAADGTNQSIDVFDRNFAPVDTTGMFTDPGLPTNFTPYNVQVLNGKVFVAYAELNKHFTNITAGAGKGVVDVYSLDGALLHHLVTNGKGSPLDEPWGLALAPKGFGTFAGKLLVGNLGNGEINAFNPTSGAFLGTLDNPKGKAIRISGLWGLSVGNATFGGSRSLVFTAGPKGYRAGLLGILNPTS